MILLEEVKRTEFFLRQERLKRGEFSRWQIKGSQRVSCPPKYQSTFGSNYLSDPDHWNTLTLSCHLCQHTQTLFLSLALSLSLSHSLPLQVNYYY